MRIFFLLASLLCLSGCSGPPLALNSEANLPPRPAVEQAVGSEFKSDAVDFHTLLENNRQVLKLVCFEGTPYALVSEPDANDPSVLVRKLLRYQAGQWTSIQQGLLLPADSFNDPAGLDALRKDQPAYVDLFGDLAVVNNRLLIIYYKARISTAVDTYNSIVATLEPDGNQWKTAFDTSGQVNLVNPDNAVERTCEPADAFFRRPQDDESILIFKFNLYHGLKTIIGQFVFPPGDVDQAYLYGDALAVVSNKDYRITRFQLKQKDAAESWKVGDLTSVVPQEGTATRILAVSNDQAFFLYDKSGHPNVGCLNLNSNAIDLMENANDKLLLSADQPEEFMSTLCDHRLFLASPKGLFCLDTVDPNHILYSFGNFLAVGGSQLLLCGADRVAGSLSVATRNADQSMALYSSKPR